MAPGTDGTTDRVFIRRAVEAAIRVAILALLIFWCFDIVRPFLVPLVWGIIIAVALHPIYDRLQAALGNRSTIAAVLLTLLMLVLVIWPAILLATTLGDSARAVAKQFADGTIAIPPPPESVLHWPLIGEPISTFWQEASQNLAGALDGLRPQIASIGSWLLSAVANIGLSILKFTAAIILAGVLLAHARGGGHTANAIAVRLAGEDGKAYADLGTATVRSVARGILGVALIQALLAGLGFLAVGLPGAGLLALICLLLAAVQIGPGLVLIGAVVYVFSYEPTPIAIAFTIWCIFVGVIDNFLKPLLLGRGVQVPMVVIFVGAIGGLLSSGIIGLFVGAVVLAVSYTIFTAWLAQAPTTAQPASMRTADPSADASRPSPPRA